ncbi:hypothetical protein NM688_g6275 [Phlebia brevispora]|uniref:Uncharacterized protein n=1 Tax=Phlebia brevispora TaxID=194682 RepID=A0ACC1SI34_9APHY|nr:hypothetical protein NM688_g6275 [Phlebia brevispora]
MATFSWSDSLHATFGPCLGCFSAQPDSEDDDHGPHYIPRARPDELEGLLADSDDAETLSLHSNVGDRDAQRRNRRRATSRKSIQLFGFYLFWPPSYTPS